MKEALRQIEEALLLYNRLCDLGTEEFNKIADDGFQALASLRSILESDAGEDEEAIKEILHDMRSYVPDYFAQKWKHDEGIAKAEAALSRLSARAKIGEAEIREAKREVLVTVEKELRKKYREKNAGSLHEVFTYENAQSVVDELMQRWGFEEGTNDKG